MLSSLRSKNLNCEAEAKFAQDRILSVEKHLAEFCHVFSQYARKVARVRDKGDEFTKFVLAYSNSEEINKSLSDGLANFAATFSFINNYGDARVQNIDNKVVNEFSQYENICKHAKEEVKQIFISRDKEINRKRHLDKIRERNPRNRQQIVQAETELVKATAEVSKTIHNLEEQITIFERQKLHDIKTILLNFICIEMNYHAKSLELLTKAYQDVNKINEEDDLKEFKNALRMPDQTPCTKKSLFRNSQSLGSLNTLFSSSNRNRSPGIPKTLQQSSAQDLSKSAETLDSMKQDIEDSIESDSESMDEENSESSESHENSSPVPAPRKFLK